MEVILPLGIFAVTFLVAWVVRRLVLRALNAWTSANRQPHGRRAATKHCADPR